MCCLIGQKLVWVKIAKKWTFLLSKVPKIINNQNFPKNTKCSKYMIFTQIFNFQLKNTPKGPPDTKDPPLDVGMTLAHQPIIQIWISLAQMVHFGWEQPLIIPDFGIFKVCAIPPTLLQSTIQSNSGMTTCFIPK